MKVFKVMSKRGSLLLVGLVLLVIMLFVSTVWAVETRSGDQIVIGPDEVIEDDLYVTASEILMEGTIRGDLVAFGNTISVGGTVEGDLIAASQSVEIGGTVERSYCRRSGHRDRGHDRRRRADRRSGATAKPGRPRGRRLDRCRLQP